MCKPGEPCPGAEDNMKIRLDQLDPEDQVSAKYAMGLHDRLHKAFPDGVADGIANTVLYFLKAGSAFDMVTRPRKPELPKEKDIGSILGAITEMLAMHSLYQRAKEHLENEGIDLRFTIVRQILDDYNIQDEQRLANARLLCEVIACDPKGKYENMTPEWVAREWDTGLFRCLLQSNGPLHEAQAKAVTAEDALAAQAAATATTAGMA